MMLQAEVQTLAAMLASGMAAGMVFDSYRMLRKKWSFIKGLLVTVCDLAFWVGLTLFVFYVLLSVNDGVVRVYVFLGLLAGTWMYFTFLHRGYAWLFERFLRFLTMLFHMLTRLFHWLLIKPIVFLYQSLVVLLLFIVGLIFSVMRLLWKLIAALCRPFRRLGRSVARPIRKKKAGFLSKVAKFFKRRDL